MIRKTSRSPRPRALRQRPRLRHGSHTRTATRSTPSTRAVLPATALAVAIRPRIDRGTLNRFLVTPASRLAIMNATVVEQAVSTTVQTLIIVALGSAGGARYPGGAAGIVVLAFASILIGVFWGALSNMTGMLLRSREAVIGVYTFFMLPLMFLSSAFMKPRFLPGWMQAIASRNPSTGRSR